MSIYHPKLNINLRGEYYYNIKNIYILLTLSKVTFGLFYINCPF